MTDKLDNGTANRSLVVRMPSTEAAMRALYSDADLMQSLAAGSFSEAFKSVALGDLSNSADERHGLTHRLIEIRAECVSGVPLLLKEGTHKDSTIIDGSAVMRLLEKPHPDMSLVEYSMIAQQIMDMRGSVVEVGDWQQDRLPLNGIPTRLDLFDPNDWEPLPTMIAAQMRLQAPITHWRHKPTGRTHEASRIIVTRHPSRKCFPFGFSPYALTTTYVETDLIAANYVKTFIKNDCNASVWLLLEGNFSPDKLKAAQSEIDDRLNGGASIGGAKVIANVKQLLTNPTTHREMQFTQGQEQIVERIATVWGVPKMLLGYSGDVNRATAFALKGAFWEMTGLGLLRRRAEALTDQFVSRLPEYRGRRVWVEHDLSAIPELQGNLTEKATTFAALVNAGVPRDQAAGVVDLGLESYEGDDVGTIGMGMTTLAAVATGGNIPEPFDLAEVDDIEPVDTAEVEPNEGRAKSQDFMRQLIIDVRAEDMQPEDGIRLATLYGGISADAATLLFTGRAAPAERVGFATPPAQDQSTGQKRLSEGLRILRKRMAGKDRWRKMRETILDPAEAKFARRMKGLLNWRKGQILRAFDSMVEAKRMQSGESKRFDAPGFSEVEPSLALFDAIFAQANADEWESRVRDRLGSIYDALGRDVAQQSIDGIAPDRLISSTLEGRWRDFADTRLGDKLRGMEQTQIESTRQAFANALDDGQTIKEIRATLRDLPDFDAARAKNVATTEIFSMANNTRQELWADLGLDTEIVWFTAGDERVRPEHVANEQHGKVVKGQPFPSGARWPHDPLARAEDVIGCRCGFEPALD